MKDASLPNTPEKGNSYVKDTLSAINIDCMVGMSDTPDGFYDWAIVDPNQGKKMSRRKNRSGSVKQENGERSLVLDGDYFNSDWDEEPASIEYFNELFRVSKNQIIWGINYFPYLDVGPGRIIWDKLNGESDQYDCEIAYCSAIDRVEIIRFMWNGMMQGENISRDPVIANRQQGNKSLNEKRYHECQKPVKLYEWQMNRFCNTTDKIVDTHLGSGSSFIANNNFQGSRKEGLFVSYENHPMIFGRTIARLDEQTAQMNLF